MDYWEHMEALWNEENPGRQIDLEIVVFPFVDMHNNLMMALDSGVGHLILQVLKQPCMRISFEVSHNFFQSIVLWSLSWITLSDLE